jgi:hypothetical protein
MEPISFLWLLVGLTAAAAGTQWLICARRGKRLGRLARQWGMTFVPVDRFRLAARIGPLLPSQGGQKVAASDVMYQTAGGRRRYLFTLDITEETAAAQRTRRCAAAAEEEIASPGEKEKPLVVRMAGEGSMMEQ